MQFHWLCALSGMLAVFNPADAGESVSPVTIGAPSVADSLSHDVGSRDGEIAGVSTCPNAGGFPSSGIITQNVSTTDSTPANACGDSNGLTTTDQGWARCYDLVTEGVLPGSNLVIRSVSFPVGTTTGSFPPTGLAVYVNIYLLPVGYNCPPSFNFIPYPGTAPYASKQLTVFAGEGNGSLPGTVKTASFDPGVFVPFDRDFVVEVEQRRDGTDEVPAWGFRPGSNSLGQCAPSYLRAADCGIPDWTKIDALGFPSDHLVHWMSAIPCPDDSDDDSDGYRDCEDGCPSDPLKAAPGLCGCGVLDTDSDGDTTPDCDDLCPFDILKIAPGICGCNVPEETGDNDGDGCVDCHDTCPGDPNKCEPGVCGCGLLDVDSDGDGAADCFDLCDSDPNKVLPGVCGCGVPEVGDLDGDGCPECVDGCPGDSTKCSPGICGCGTTDTDSDLDGVANCNDDCPEDPSKLVPGVCGCGVPEADTDGDSVFDCQDVCPNEDDTIDENVDDIPDCAAFGGPIPTTTGWGLVILILLLLTTAKIRFGYPQSRTA